jgi:plastocyanin
MTTVARAPIVLGLVVLLACGSSEGSGDNNPTGPPPSGPTTESVSAIDFQFSPGNTEISVGSTVTWTNNGQSTHTVTSDSGQWDSGSISAPSSGNGTYGGGASAGGSYTRTFGQAGTFMYHCSIHPNMRASVTVTD